MIEAFQWVRRHGSISIESEILVTAHLIRRTEGVAIPPLQGDCHELTNWLRYRRVPGEVRAHPQGGL